MVDQIKKKIICFIILACILAINIVNKIDFQNIKSKQHDYSQKKYEKIITEETNEKQNVTLYAKSAALVDADTNRVLYSKNGDIEMPMASTTKIMTCICALENCNEDDIVTISNKAASQPQVKLGISENDKIKLNYLLYSLMLESHNDSAVAIAEHISGSVEEFAKLMNQKARDLGCFNTYFITPNGLDASATLEDNTVITHHTTAVDLAKIMNYCVYQSPQKEKFLEITRTPSINISNESNSSSYSLSNHNAALTLIDGAVSGKTGFTNNAGYCYIGTFIRNNKKMTVALLACGWPNNKTYKWKDAKALIEYGDKNFNFESIDMADDDTIPSTVKVYNCSCFCEDSKTSGIKIEYTDTSDEEGIKYLKSPNEKETITYCLPENIKDEVEEGEIIGTAEHIINNCIIAEYPIKVTSTITKNTFYDYIDEVFKLIFL